MTPMEAWNIVSANLAHLYRQRKKDFGKGWDNADLEAEVMCYKALKELQKQQDSNKDKE